MFPPKYRDGWCSELIIGGVIGSGAVWVGDREHPTWSVVQEPHDNSLYFGGPVDSHIVRSVIDQLRRVGDVLVGMWLDDPRLELLPGDHYYDGRTLEFYDRPLGSGLSQYLDRLPNGCELHRLDRHSILHTEWGPADIQFAGGPVQWEQTHLGFCLLKEGHIVAEATAGPPALGLYEPGVFTQEAHRHQGYGTLVSARLIQEIETLGGRTYWNCAAQNLASAAIARKLGYRLEKEYRCIAWKKT